MFYFKVPLLYIHGETRVNHRTKQDIQFSVLDPKLGPPDLKARIKEMLTKLD
jgi:hypothetical protein